MKIISGISWSRSRSLIFSVRACRRFRSRSNFFEFVAYFFSKSLYYFNSTITGSEIQVGAKLGDNLILPHPTGVVIHRDAVIGSNCMIMQQVTLGQLASPGAPILGNHVYVGAGAKILGAVSIGDGASIGANAVVLIDVPAGCTAVGVPARIVKRPKSIDRDFRV